MCYFICIRENTRLLFGIPSKKNISIFFTKIVDENIFTSKLTKLGTHEEHENITNVIIPRAQNTNHLQVNKLPVQN